MGTDLERTKIVTPASLILGPIVLAFGVLVASYGGGAGAVLILAGLAMTILGVVTRSQRVREAAAFDLAMLLHAADDPDDDDDQTAIGR
jgi:hypothetical protein